MSACAVLAVAAHLACFAAAKMEGPACSPSAGGDGVRCASDDGGEGQCIVMLWVCDGYADCTQGEDEEGCPATGGFGF